MECLLFGTLPKQALHAARHQQTRLLK